MLLSIRYTDCLLYTSENPANLFQIKLYLTDPVVKQLKKDVDKQYADLDWLEKELYEAFKRILYFDSTFKIPKVFTYISGGDFEFPVKYAENNLIIALDMYLGQSYPIYAQWGIPVSYTHLLSRHYWWFFIILPCETLFH